MQPTEFDFSDIFIKNDEWPRVPKPIDGLCGTDSAVIRWFGRLVASRNDGTLRWSSDRSNLEAFRAWPACTSDDNLDGRLEGPVRRPKKRTSRRR